jgi:hypothetical protein
MSDEVLFIIPGAEGEESIGRRAIFEEDTTADDLLRAANLDPQQWGIEIKQGQETVTLARGDKLSEYVQAGAKVFGVPMGMTVGLAA